MGPDSLSQIDSEELFFFREDTYTSETKTKLDEVFKKLFREGKIYSCSFASELWPCTNGVEKVTINFSMSRILCDASFGKKFNVHYSTISKMIRYYALSLTPNNIFRTISNKINTITDFLTHYGRTIIQKKRIEINYIMIFCRYSQMIVQLTACDGESSFLLTTKRQKPSPAA